MNSGWVCLGHLLHLTLRLTPALAVLAALAGFMFISGSSSPHVNAANPASTDFAMEVVGAPGCTTDADPPEASCNAPSGTFTVRVRLNSLGDLDDYSGFQTRLNHSDGLTFRDSRVLGIWPDCGIPARYLDSSHLLVGCVVGIGQPASTYLGPIAEADFDCPSTPSPEEITLIHDGRSIGLGLAEGTHIVDTLAANIHFDKDPNEVLTINCTEPPLPPTRPHVRGIMGVDCDASTPGIQSECSYGIGEEFAVHIHIVQPPTDGYLWIAVTLRWNDGQLDYLPAASFADEVLWPACDVFDDILPPTSTTLKRACVATSLSSGDMTTGPILKFKFRCIEASSTPLKLVGNFNGGTFLGSASGDSSDVFVSDAAIACREASDVLGASVQGSQAAPPRSLPSTGASARSSAAWWPLMPATLLLFGAASIVGGWSLQRNAPRRRGTN